MRHIYLLLLSVILPLFTIGQSVVPGYMGKRWNIQYQLYTWPSFSNPNNEEVNPELKDGFVDVKTSMNFQSHIIGGYSVSKRLDLIADFNFAKTNFDPYYTLYDLEPNSISFPKMSATGGAIGIRLYRKHFAPVGPFVVFKLGYTTLNIDGLEYQTSDYSYNPNKSLSIDGGSKGGATITAGFGTNRVISDRFMINYGVDFTFFTGGMFNWKTFGNNSRGDSIDYGDGNTDANQEIYLKKAAARYAMMCMVNLKIGIGILL